MKTGEAIFDPRKRNTLHLKKERNELTRQKYKIEKNIKVPGKIERNREGLIYKCKRISKKF
tara:strand:- start:542 stop:724 length:183 start_codon:yes stop_codon:yes gene_type:complete